MLSDSCLIDSDFQARDVALCFNLSMMCQVNEVTEDRHMKMQLVEFLEAIARASDRLSLPPHEENRIEDSDDEEVVAEQEEIIIESSSSDGDDEVDIEEIQAMQKNELEENQVNMIVLSQEISDEDEEEIQMSWEERIEQPLAVKINNILPHLLPLCRRNFKKNFSWPFRDKETGVFDESNALKSAMIKAFKKKLNIGGGADNGKMELNLMSKEQKKSPERKTPKAASSKLSMLSNKIALASMNTMKSKSRQGLKLMKTTTRDSNSLLMPEPKSGKLGTNKKLSSMKV